MNDIVVLKETNIMVSVDDIFEENMRKMARDWFGQMMTGHYLAPISKDFKKLLEARSKQDIEDIPIKLEELLRIALYPYKYGFLQYITNVQDGASILYGDQVFHFIHGKTEWHCFFGMKSDITHFDPECRKKSGNHYKGGPHLHYISSHYGGDNNPNRITKDDLLEMLRKNERPVSGAHVKIVY